MLSLSVGSAPPITTTCAEPVNCTLVRLTPRIDKHVLNFSHPNVEPRARARGRHQFDGREHGGFLRTAGKNLRHVAQAAAMFFCV